VQVELIRLLSRIDSTCPPPLFNLPPPTLILYRASRSCLVLPANGNHPQDRTFLARLKTLPTFLFRRPSFTTNNPFITTIRQPDLTPPSFPALPTCLPSPPLPRLLSAACFSCQAHSLLLTSPALTTLARVSLRGRERESPLTKY
jgi:hypothetical protein